MKQGAWIIAVFISFLWIFACIQTITKSNKTTRDDLNDLYRKAGALKLTVELEKAIIKNKSCLMPYQVDSVYNSIFK